MVDGIRFPTGTRDVCFVCYALENTLHGPTGHHPLTDSKRTVSPAVAKIATGTFDDHEQRKRFDRKTVKSLKRQTIVPMRKTRKTMMGTLGRPSLQGEMEDEAPAIEKLIRVVKTTLDAIRKSRLQRLMQKFMVDFIGDRRGVVQRRAQFRGLGVPAFVKEVPEATRHQLAYWDAYKNYWKRAPSLCGRDFRDYRTKTAAKCEREIRAASRGAGSVEEALLPQGLIQRPCTPGELYASVGLVRYVESCSRMGRAPRLPPFLVTEPEKEKGEDLEEGEEPKAMPLQFEKFTMSHSFGRGDHLNATTDALLASGRAVDEVLLGGGSFSGQAMFTLLQALVFMGPSKVQLLTVVLSGNRLNEAAVQTLCDIMRDDSGRNITRLELNDVPVPTGSWKKLAKQIGNHPALTKLGIARTGLGRIIQSNCVAVAQAVGVCRRLEDLDISGNYVGHEGADAFAEAIADAGALKVLDFSWNAGGFDLTKTRKYCPMHPILESLALSPNLRDARFTDCMLDSDADLIIEDAMMSRETLEDLDLASNPHGVEGLRCLLRVVAKTNSLNIRLHRLRESHMAGSGRYEYQHPDGRHELDLSLPANRALMRLLWRRAEEAAKMAGNSSPAAAFNDLVWNGKSLGKDKGLASVGIELHNERWGPRLLVPMEGHISFTLCLAEPQPLPWGTDAGVVLRRHFQALKITFSFKHYVAVSFMYKSLEFEHLQKILIAAAKKDLHLKFAHIRDLIDASPAGFGPYVARHLLHCVGCFQTRWHHGILCLNLKEWEVERLAKKSDKMIWFNERCMEGRYELDLGVRYDYETALRLVIVNKWSQAASLEAGLADLSQNGDRSGIRNAFFRNKPLYKGWDLPRFLEGERVPFEFDYTFSARTVGKHLGQPTEDYALEQMIDLLADTDLPSICRKNALRAVGHELNLNGNQLAAIAISFSGGTECPHSRPSTPSIEVVDCSGFHLGNRKALIAPTHEEGEEDREHGRRAGLMTGIPERERSESKEENEEEPNEIPQNEEETKEKEENEDEKIDPEKEEKEEIPKEAFDPETDRVCVIHMLFGRCREQHQAVSKTCLYDGDLISKEEGAALCHRLGPLRTLELQRCQIKDTLMGNSYKFDLTCYEYRVMARVFLTLTAKEASSELLHPTWSPWKPLCVGDFFVVPSDWAKEIPYEGMFMFEYHHYLDNSENSQTRLEVARKYFGWPDDWELPHPEDEPASPVSDE